VLTIRRLEQEIALTWSYNHRSEYALLQKRNGWAVEPGVNQDNLLTVNNTYNNPSLACGGIYFNDLDVILNQNYEFCYDWPGICF
jgi:hypothetical protein